jgi:cytochrome c oxidase cbb3-type subunit 3
MTAGGVAFQTNCAPCHGRGAQGFVGYPNLNDDDWIWGGKIEDVHKTIQFGIRGDHKQSRANQMPRYGVENIFTDAQISDAADFVLSLSGQQVAADAKERGTKLFAENCATCHGPKGEGNIELGAPNLTDGIWLYGGERAQVIESIRTGRGGAMPAWIDRLDPITVKALAVYVHSLGGGK